MNRYKKSVNEEPTKQYYRTINLLYPLDNTDELVDCMQAALKSVFAFGYEFQKVGVILSNLIPGDFQQQDLFMQGPDRRIAKLSTVMDTLNRRYGRDNVRVAGAGYDPSWHHKREYLSPCYTTKWKDILNVE